MCVGEDMKMIRVLSLFLLGAGGYCTIELLWRKRTHWSMGLAGGLCLALLHQMNRLLCRQSWALRCAAGSAIITAVEFLTGCIVNLKLGLKVWDYRDMPLNCKGQVCALYSFLWFLLCIPVLRLSSLLHFLDKVPQSSMEEKLPKAC